jgi:hypothetical protein
MRKVFKYNIPFADHFTMELPIGAEILKVDMQANDPKMWALVNPNASPEIRHFRWAGTGHEITEQYLKHIDTFFMYETQLVWHIFEVVG